MAVQYAPTKLRVPPGFQNLLEGLSREVLREQPSNIIQFAANYFKDQLLIRNETGKDDAKKGSDMEKLQNEEEIDIDLNDPSTENAALKIQAVFRGHKGRQETKQKKEEEAAATKIQAGFRGHQARKSVKEMKSSESNLNEEGSTHDDAGDDGGEYVESVTKNEDFETSGADEEMSFDDVKYEEAATKIQAGFRGHKVREEIKSKTKLDENSVESITEDDPKYVEAATKIQAGFRGHKVREEMKSKTQLVENDAGERSADAEKTEENGDTAEDDQGKEEEAAIKIQSSFRGHVARKEVAAMKSNQNIEDDVKGDAAVEDLDKSEEEAATKIQAGYRGYVARKEVNAMKSSENVQGEVENASASEQPLAEDEEQAVKAATKIQASYRGYRVRSNMKPDEPPAEVEESAAKEDEEIHQDGGNEET